MSHSRFYDTVAFDVRGNTTMLMFAKTSEIGDIKDYLLLMRSIEDDFEESLYIEINEEQFNGHDLLKSAQLLGNALTLELKSPAQGLDDAEQIVITFEETENNFKSMEIGAFRVLGDALRGASA